MNSSFVSRIPGYNIKFITVFLCFIYCQSSVIHRGKVSPSHQSSLGKQFLRTSLWTHALDNYSTKSFFNSLSLENRCGSPEAIAKSIADQLKRTPVENVPIVKNQSPRVILTGPCQFSIVFPFPPEISKELPTVK